MRHTLEDRDVKIIVGALMGDRLTVAGHPECQALAERLLRERAKFSEGDEVVWYESPHLPENVGEVQEVKIVGFPETRPDTLELAYEVYFYGRTARGAPSGCTAPAETHDVPEHGLRTYEGEETCG